MMRRKVNVVAQIPVVSSPLQEEQGDLAQGLGGTLRAKNAVDVGWIDGSVTTD